MIAYKTHGPNGDGIPEEWPSVETIIPDDEADAYREQGFTCVSADQYVMYKAAHQAAYDAWMATKAQENMKKYVSEIVDQSIRYGRTLVVEFGAENVLMGIQQMGQTNRVRKAMAEVVNALQAGALSDAIYECRQVPVEQMDGTFLSPARLLTFINKVEAFMGEPLSTEF